MIETFVLRVDNKSICGVLHLPLLEKPPCVITCHGLFSSKDSDKFLSIARVFTDRGIAVIRFDFSGCGESTGSIADTTVTGRLAELTAVVQFARQHQLPGPRLGLLGSSLGGYLSLLYAAQDTVNQSTIRLGHAVQPARVAGEHPAGRAVNAEGGFFH